MQPADFLYLSLAAFCLSYAIAHLSLPFSIMDRIKSVTTIGGLLICYYCVSWWVALALYIIQYRSVDLIASSAIAGAAAFLYRYTGGSAL